MVEFCMWDLYEDTRGYFVLSWYPTRESPDPKVTSFKNVCILHFLCEEVVFPENDPLTHSSWSSIIGWKWWLKDIIDESW